MELLTHQECNKRYLLTLFNDFDELDFIVVKWLDEKEGIFKVVRQAVSDVNMLLTV